MSTSKGSGSTSAAPSAAAAKGSSERQIGSYIYTGTKLGEGSFAKVYLFRHMVDHTEVAIKALDHKKMLKTHTDPYAEIRALQKLQGHPNIVKLIDTHRNQDYTCAVLEYCPGGDLSGKINSLLRASTKAGANFIMDEATVRRLGFQLVDAMCYLQDNNVMHRDVKPANILLTEKDIAKASVKLADLGFAKGETSMLTSQLGTGLYMAPERLQRKEYDFQAEVWAIGVIMYEMFYGVPPFGHAVSYDDLAVKSQQPIEFPDVMPPLSDTFKDLINKMTCYEPTSRISIYDAKKHAFFRPPPPLPVLATSMSMPSVPTTATPLDDIETDDIEIESDQRTRFGASATAGSPHASPTPTGHTTSDVEPHVATAAPSHARADVGTSPLRPVVKNGPPSPPSLQTTSAANSTTTNTTTVRSSVNNNTSHHHSSATHTSTNASVARHVDPSSFSVPLMNEDTAAATAKAPSTASPSTGTPEPTPRTQASSHTSTASSHVGPMPGATSHNWPSPPLTHSGYHGGALPPGEFALPPSNSSLGSCPGSFTVNRVFGGVNNPSPVVASMYHFRPTKPALENARVVAWAAREHPVMTHRAQLYYYAAQVAMSFELDTSNDEEHELVDFRDECLALARRTLAALSEQHKPRGVSAMLAASGSNATGSPKTLSAPPPHAVALKTAILWMHAAHDPSLVTRLSTSELESMYRGSATLCDVVREDPNCEPSTRSDAAIMKDLILARLGRIREDPSRILLYGA